MLRQPGEILCPEGAVSAAQLQDLHAVRDPALFIDPGEPALPIDGMVSVQTNPGGDVGGILVLKLQTLFHAGEMDQLQHMAPVDLMRFFNGPDRVLDGALHELHLFDPVLDQPFLHIQGIFQKMIICIADGHLPDVIQRETQIFQEQDLLESCQIRVRIETGAGGVYIRRLQDILFVIIPDGPHGYACKTGELSGGMIAWKFHK